MSASVSVIVPTYNVGRYIDQALGSVVGQTFDDWELVVVDDGSSGDTVALPRMGRRDPRIRLLVPGARLRLAERAAQPGDRRERRRVRRAARRRRLLDLHAAAPDRGDAPRPDLLLLFDDSQQVDAEGTAMGSYFEMLRFRERAAEHFDEPSPGLFVARPSFLFFSSCAFHGMQPGVVLRRSALAGMDPIAATDLPNAADNDLWWRLMMKGPVGFVPEARMPIGSTRAASRRTRSSPRRTACAPTFATTNASGTCCRRTGTRCTASASPSTSSSAGTRGSAATTPRARRAARRRAGAAAGRRGCDREVLRAGRLVGAGAPCLANTRPLAWFAGARRRCLRGAASSAPAARRP
ncbi:MAG: glycosyltransferase family 2 protein [Comamonadaceae bacterium]|nr:glycosyltransferase family 2 protein [Comamonadaceae bacterium]